MILRKKIIGLLGSVEGNAGLFREELAERLGISVSSVDEAAAGLIECGLLKVETIAEGRKKSLRRYFLGKGASMIVIIRDNGGIRLSARCFDGEEIQRKYVMRNCSLTLREDAEDVAALFAPQIALLLNDNSPCAFGALVRGEESEAWRRVGAELVVDEDIYSSVLELSKASRTPDVFARLKADKTFELSVMRRGEEIVARRSSNVDRSVGLAELVNLFESDNFTLAFDEGLEDEAADMIDSVQKKCAEYGLGTNFILDSYAAREELFFKILRNRLCDKAFKLKRNNKKRRV